MKTLIFAMAATLFASVASAQNNTKPTVVLVHGAWSDVSAWKAVTPLLEAKGINVVAVNLPGHGSDKTPFTSITLQSYVDAVKNEIGDLKNVILVGHSMAGIVISQVAEDMPENIKKLVYLAAYLPANGQSLLDLAKTDAGSHVGKFLQIDQATASAGIGKDGAVDIFVADASKDVQDKFAGCVQPDPLVPFASPVTLSAKNFGSLEKVYIYTTNDHAISLAAQQSMVKNAKVKREHTLKSSHTPFISMPGQLANILIKEAK
ncbi:Pimeloyl-ACP methyl ester carboxylesterase [Dyadobacter koreensis]|uniref:Pimeloyl-ACP methyl ester carboxylesterase n=1 Tax=Dyadobacter koreensis TaxID=408657 RepID=A0A1H7A6D0_9BACT|nr:alpha/beta fold hydrolase [Dyadobacter koreensis]SEJ61151.1 Pimeloyl-ACP methyl ester carboxylesterase [Dyadobacter koreensis]